jgi:hypothetical protein
MDMTATGSNDSTAIPSISGTSNINVKPLPGSISVLVIIHAVCLAGSFLLLFPLGVVVLRWFGRFKWHWMLQIVATFICVIGLVIAVVLSIMDPEYVFFSEGHQIIGIVVVAALIVQALLGYLHHRDYTKLGRRTWFSHSHLWVGRVVIVMGMINAVLYVKLFLPSFLPLLVITAKINSGFLLAGSNGGSIGIAIFALIILTGTVAVVYFGAKRRRSASGTQHLASSDNIVLSSYEPSRGEGDGHGGDYRDGPRTHGRGFV